MNRTWGFALIMLTLWGLISYFHIYFERFVDIPLLLLVLSFSYIAKEQENIIHITIGLLLFIAIEFVGYELIAELWFAEHPAYVKNTLTLSFQLLMDVGVFFYLKNRVRLSTYYVNRFAPKKQEYIYMTHADILLVGLFFLFMLVDLATLAENIIRNLEYFGVDESFAKQFWSWNWFYKAYPYIKSILLSCVITVLLATVYVERFRPAPIKESEEDSTLKKSEPQHRS